MLSPEHRKLLVVEQGVVALVFNVVINGGMAWLLFRSIPAVPLWGESSVAVDLIATALLLPLLSCLIVSKIVFSKVQSGKLSPLPSGQIPDSGWSYRSSMTRGLFLGACAILLAALPIVGALSIADSAVVQSMSFVGYKAIWAGVLAGVISPIIAWWALAEASRVQSTSNARA